MGDQRHIAFYLPQYHQIPENADWWGPGFTEWTNVAQARPRFRGHYQPHVPRDLGFYDLRLPETRAAQADLARSHGIDAFCYYHYWFDGRQLLERPFAEVLSSGEPDFPFCLAWANENWTRTWDGDDRQVLMPQLYKNPREHGRWLARAFADERYVRVDGKPLFLVYRASDLPDARAVTEIWREEARAAGVGEIYLCKVDRFPSEFGKPAEMGFDAAAEFAPDGSVYRPSARDVVGKVVARSVGARLDYERLRDAMLRRPDPGYLRFPCVSPGWDNSPRRARGSIVVEKSTPGAYQEWVRAASARAPQTDTGDSLVFVNAWNEWGEGAHLEPDLRWGRAYLEAHLAGRAAAGL